MDSSQITSSGDDLVPVIFRQARSPYARGERAGLTQKMFGLLSKANIVERDDPVQTDKQQRQGSSKDLKESPADKQVRGNQTRQKNGKGSRSGGRKE